MAGTWNFPDSDSILIDRSGRFREHRESESWEIFEGNFRIGRISNGDAGGVAGAI
jgi:hypothetical protein